MPMQRMWSAGTHASPRGGNLSLAVNHLPIKSHLPGVLSQKFPEFSGLGQTNLLTYYQQIDQSGIA